MKASDCSLLSGFRNEIGRGEVDVILRSLGYMKPSLVKFWPPNKPMKLTAAFGARSLSAESWAS